MARLLEFLDWEFKTTMINMIRTLIDKVDSVRMARQCEQRDEHF